MLGAPIHVCKSYTDRGMYCVYVCNNNLLLTIFPTTCQFKKFDNFTNPIKYPYFTITSRFRNTVTVIMKKNSFFLCVSPQGSA